MACGISRLRSKSDFRSPAVPNCTSFGPPRRFSLPKSCSSNFSLHNGLFNDQKQAFWTDFRPFLDEKGVIFLLLLRDFYVMLMFLCCFLFLHEFSACCVVVRSENTRLTANVKLHKCRQSECYMAPTPLAPWSPPVGAQSTEA